MNNYYQFRIFNGIRHFIKNEINLVNKANNNNFLSKNFKALNQKYNFSKQFQHTA